MQHWDEQIMLLFQNCRCEALTVFFKIFIPLPIWIGIALLIVAYAAIRTGVLRAPVISFCLARQMSFYWFNWAKDFFHRPRPFVTMHQLVPLDHPHGFSFPSGHSTLAMASAVVLAYHFPKVRPVVFSLAVLTGLSRIYLGVHYLTDVLAGFVLGAILGGVGILLERVLLALFKGIEFSKK